MLDRLLLPLLTSSFLILAIAWPLLRTWRRHRVFALVVQKAQDPLGRFVGRGFGVGVAAIAAWSALYALVGPEPLGVWAVPLAVRAAGSLVAVAGLALVLVAQAQMGASWRIGIDDVRTGLIDGGVYRWVRHPIYTGLLAMLVGVVGLTPSAWSLMGAGWIASLIVVQARLEDVHLERGHGAAWRDWARRTGRLLPGMGRLDSGVGA